MADAKKNPVKQARPEVDKVLQRCEVINDLLAGTVGMRDAGERYIPKRSGESDKKWRSRVDDAVLHNAYARTVGYLTGQVFSKDVVLDAAGETLPEPYAAMFEDVDLQGNSLSVWAARFFADAVNSKANLVLVEFPQVETRTNEAGRLEYLDAATGEYVPKTAEADAQNGWRPYFVSIPTACVLGWRIETINGRQTITQFRFKERVIEEQGQFDVEDEYCEQVRVLYRGRYEIWRKVETGTTNGEETWAVWKEGTVSMPEIPLATFFPSGNEMGLVTLPALEDLAHLNRRHWQATAEHNELMRFVRAPGLFLAGGTVDANGASTMPWGPGILSVDTNPEAKISPIGVDAASVTASRQELKDIEEAMALYGLQLLMPKTGDVTATEKALGASESDSTLKRWALGLKDCLEQAFTFAGQWVGAEELAPSVSVNTEYHMLTGVDPATIIAATEKGIIPKEMAFNEFKRRGLLPDDADWQDAEAMFEAQNRQGAAVTPARQIASSILAPGAGNGLTGA